MFRDEGESAFPGTRCAASAAAVSVSGKVGVGRSGSQRGLSKPLAAPSRFALAPPPALSSRESPLEELGGVGGGAYGSDPLRAPGAAGPGGTGPSGRGRGGGDALEESPRGGRKGPGRVLLGALELPDVPGARLHAVGACAALAAAPSSFTAVLTPWQPRQGNM